MDSLLSHEATRDEAGPVGATVYPYYIHTAQIHFIYNILFNSRKVVTFSKEVPIQRVHDFGCSRYYLVCNHVILMTHEMQLVGRK